MIALTSRACEPSASRPEGQEIFVCNIQSSRGLWLPFLSLEGRTLALRWPGWHDALLFDAHTGYGHEAARGWGLVPLTCTAEQAAADYRRALGYGTARPRPRASRRKTRLVDPRQRGFGFGS